MGLGRIWITLNFERVILDYRLESGYKNIICIFPFTYCYVPWLRAWAPQVLLSYPIVSLTL